MRLAEKNEYLQMWQDSGRAVEVYTYLVEHDACQHQGCVEQHQKKLLPILAVHPQSIHAPRRLFPQLLSVRARSRSAFDWGIVYNASQTKKHNR